MIIIGIDFGNIKSVFPSL